MCKRFDWLVATDESVHVDNHHRSPGTAVWPRLSGSLALKVIPGFGMTI